ncbi:MAG: DsrE family protein [candidate division NC10 bacterium]|nr:DsrE family protein [candidate division NC10 bacterium]
MVKVAIVVLSDTATRGDMGRVANALEAVRDFGEAEGEIKLIFDGAGTKWLCELSEPDHPLHGLFESVKADITGACSSCAVAFGAKEGIQASGIPLLAEYDKKLGSHGYRLIAY